MKTRKNVYLAYFDVLGFKGIVGKRYLTEVEDFFYKLLLNTESAVSDERCDGSIPSEYCANLNSLNLNCLHISDSIIFWTNTDDAEDLNRIINCCDKLVKNRTIPCKLLRGCLTHGEISYNFYSSPQISTQQSIYHDYSIIGQPIIDAYTKAESLQLTGCVLDRNIIRRIKSESLEKIVRDGIIAERIIPTKFGISLEYVYTPAKGGYTEVGFKNDVESLKRAYEFASKCSIANLSEDAQRKLYNTIEFYRSFLNVQL